MSWHRSIELGSEYGVGQPVSTSKQGPQREANRGASDSGVGGCQKPRNTLFHGHSTFSRMGLGHRDEDENK